MPEKLRFIWESALSFSGPSIPFDKKNPCTTSSILKKIITDKFWISRS